MKVAFTRQPRHYINNFNFFTEADQDRTDVNLDKNAKDATSGDPQKATNAFKDMMSKFGNSLTRMFKQLMEWVKELPKLAKRILGYLKDLWGKIKGWCIKFHIIDRTKSLSMITVYFIGFIASMVVSVICLALTDHKYGRTLFKNAKYYDLKGRRYIKRFKNPEKYMHNPGTAGATKTPQKKESIDEIAVFIETFGEILREDSNGGMFMAMAKKAIAMSINKTKALYKACRDSANKSLTSLVNCLTTSVCGSNATLTAV